MTRARRFKSVIFYQEFAAAIDAREVVESIAAQFREQFDLELDFWKLAMLECPQIQEQAAPGLARADIIVFAAAGLKDLSENARAWLEESLARNLSGGVALVALFAQQEVTTNASAALCAYLQKLAAERHLEFFSNLGCAPPAAPFGFQPPLKPNFAQTPDPTTDGPVPGSQYAN
jgi:hypothetical protein